MVFRALILFSLFVGVLDVTPGYACSCASPGTVCSHFWQVSTVFAGTVTAIEPVAERPGMLAVHFAVDQRGRGVDGDTIVIEAAPQNGVNCGYTFQMGGRYVVYASDGPGERPTTTMCSGTKPAAQAAADLAFLDEVNGPPQGVRVFGQVRRFEIDLVTSRSRDYGGVSGARVELMGSAASRIATTGQNGSYEFRDLSAGTYTVTITVPPGLAFRGSLQSGADRQTRSRTVTLTNPSQCADVSVGPLTDAQVTGMLVYADGRVADGETIDLIAAENASRLDREIPSVTVRTGAEGRFAFAFIPPGRYLIGSNLRNPPPASQIDRRAYHPGVTDSTRATVVTIEAGSRIQLTQFRLPEWPVERRISGTIVWADGVPAPGAELTLHGARAQRVPVDPSGQFNLTLPYGAQFGLQARGVRIVDRRNRSTQSPYRTLGRDDRDTEITLVLPVPQ